MSSNKISHLMDKMYDPVRSRSYIALDVPTADTALEWVSRFGDAVDGYKVGLQLFHAAGQSLIQELLKRNKRIFLDVKLHDIPNTVAGALTAICQYPIEMVNVHALGGLRMMEAARKAVDKAPNQPLLIGVTVLTSMAEEDLAGIGIGEQPLAAVERLTHLAMTAGLDGIVASAQELPSIYRIAPASFETVIPGTRPKGADVNDQRRTLTPGEAIAAGATRLVLGRAVLAQPDPFLALRNIWDDMLHNVN